MNQSEAQLDLRGILRVLRTRWLWVALPTIVITAIVILASQLTQPMYRSSAELVLESRAAETLATGVLSRNEAAASPSTDRRQTEIQVLLGERVAERVSERTEASASVRAEAFANANIIVVTAESDEPQDAADVANAYATEYIEFRRLQAVEDLQAASKRLELQIESLSARIVSVDLRIGDLDRSATPAAAAGAKPAIDDATSIAFAPLEAERVSLLRQRDTLQNQVDGLQIDAALRSGGAVVNTAATTPEAPFSPNLGKNVLFGFPMALMAGIALAILRNAFDDSIRDRDDMVSIDPHVPVLAVIGNHGRRVRLFDVAQDPLSVTAESFRSLRVSLQFLAVDRPVRVIQVVSAVAGEGKTTVAANLAATFASGGQSVVLIDADLRVSSINPSVPHAEAYGLSSVLAGTASLAGSLVRMESLPALRVLPAGLVPPNPVELLASQRLAEVLESLLGQVDIVVIDSPPLLPVADPLVLSEHADAVMLVVRAEKTARRQVARAVQLLRGVNAPLVGFVLNDAAESKDAYSNQLYTLRSRPGRWRRNRTLPPTFERPEEPSTDLRAPVYVDGSRR